MSLTSIRSISDQLPVIFIEARMQGNPNTVLAQLGFSLDADQCNVAVFTRTSGVLLVAGVGSYIVYRMFVRFLGRDFMWMLVGQTRIDTLNRSDIRLLHPANIAHGSDMDIYSTVLADDERSGSCSETSTRTRNTFLSSEFSRTRRRYLASSPVRGHALSILPTQVEQENRRKPLGSEGGSIGSSRRQPGGYCRIRNRRLSTRSVSEASYGLSQISFTPSEKSASLRLLWDDPQWDSELDLMPEDVIHRQNISPSDISEMSEFLAAKNVFGDTSSSKIDEEGGSIERIDSESAQGDTTSESMMQARELIERSCMTGSQHLYQIVAECITNSDAVSVCSGRSTQSFLALRQRAAAGDTSAGLLELARPSLDHGRHFGAPVNSMTDSAISKDTVTSSNARNMNRSALFDSAIGTDFVSSEDEGGGPLPSNICFSMVSPAANNTPSIVRRSGLKLINEDQQSVSISERSLEWFEDELCFAVESSSAECGNNQYSPLADFSTSQVEHSQADDFSRAVAEASTSLVANYRLLTLEAECDSEHSSRRSLPTTGVRLHGTRDLMVWAREQFTSDSPQMKVLQTLYTSERRLKRIGVKRSDDLSTHLLASVLHSAIYHNLDVFSCSNFDIVHQAVIGAFARYDFLKQWQFPTNSASQADSSNTVSNDRLAIDVMRTLWDVQHSSDIPKERIPDVRCVEALRLMIVLRAIDVFENLDEIHSLPRSFYSRLFADHDPRQIMHRIVEGIFDENELCLLADTLRIRMEVFDCSKLVNDTTPLTYVYPDRENSFPVLPFVKVTTHYIYPVYYMTD
uniref:RUN domain-containing protein n=1 Tax=Parascaris univalens TaxID=6257 RepID=A0A915B431_PARUN